METLQCMMQVLRTRSQGTSAIGSRGGPSGGTSSIRGECEPQARHPKHFGMVWGGEVFITVMLSSFKTLADIINESLKVLLFSPQLLNLDVHVQIWYILWP